LDVSLGNRCNKEISPLLINTHRNEGIEVTTAAYKKMKKTEADTYFFFEGSLNSFEYELLKGDKIKDVIEIFKLNIEEYPASGNAYDSMGEVYMLGGNTKLAI
jgi:hypothetical protein